jgi:hypothetical protein
MNPRHCSTFAYCLGEDFLENPKTFNRCASGVWYLMCLCALVRNMSPYEKEHGWSSLTPMLGLMY